MAGNRRHGGPVKVSVVGGGGGGSGSQRGSGIWRRERIEMTEPELDDVAFLTGKVYQYTYIQSKKLPFMIFIF